MRWLLLLFAAGCVESSSVDCGGQICAEGTVCRLVTNPDVHVCATQAQLDACESPAVDGSCTLSGVAAARCYDGVCLPAGCGNQRMDPNEACDDGNQAAADGCSADCRSTEVCGNGAIDPLQGESCDDGNRISHDGCTSGCVLETPSWQQWTLDAPMDRERAAIAYDPVRQQVVMFGGRRQSQPRESETDETWLWNGTSWQRAAPAVSPPAREGAAMTYDASRDRMVMFGGSVGAVDLGDTWEWDGVTWTVRESTSSPFARANHAMAYDSKRKRVEMYGGDSYGSALGDIWEWDGAAWAGIHAPTAPPARSQFVMVYDPTRGVTVAFGGRDSNVSIMGDTWEWNGTTWSSAADQAQLVRYSMAGAFDVSRQKIVLSGGTDGSSVFNDTLSWSGTAWTVLTAANQPNRFGHMIASDIERKRLVQFGGRDEISNLTGGTRELGPSGWVQAQQQGFLARHGIAHAYDELRHRGVLFGGGTEGPPTAMHFADTWEVVGTTMVRRAVTGPTTIGPSARQFAAMAYDPVRKETVLFGGQAVAAALQDTWVWDGSVWAQRTSTMVPSARWGAAMAFDRARGKIVLFGGTSSGTNSFSDTWEWNGVAWIQASPATSPPSRRGAALAYDPIKQSVVMFGGEAHMPMLSFLDDTWQWDGTTWAPVMVATKPLSRGHAGLAYSANRRRLVLFGGRRSVNSVANDAWEWDGAAWQRLTVPGTPPARFGQALIPSEDGSGVTAIGGAQLDGVGNPRSLADLWRLTWGRGTGPEELCRDALDRDGDMLGGCADLDCWHACKPLCPPGVSCAQDAPVCGDMRCDAFETCRLCPGDCGACPAVCGDYVCSPGETCPGDC